MTSSPLLIVVPTLNSYHLLPRLLRSLQQQIWPHWRLLFIDGHSRLEHRNWLVECCNSEPRCTWVAQGREYDGIFGAMNQGFALADKDDWVLFWGSDDWAASNTLLHDLSSFILKHDLSPSDNILLVTYGQYISSTDLLLRFTKFSDKFLFHSHIELPPLSLSHSLCNNKTDT